MIARIWYSDISFPEPEVFPNNTTTTALLSRVPSDSLVNLGKITKKGRT